MKKLLLLSLLSLIAPASSGMELPASVMAKRACLISAFNQNRDYPAVKDILRENYSKLVNPLNGFLFLFEDSQQEQDDNILAKLNDPHFHYTVIRDRHDTVGFIKYRPSVSTCNVMHIDLLAIAQKNKQKGYGKKLIEYVAQQAKRQGLKFIRLCPTEESIPFYRKIGFVPQDHNDNWIKGV